MPLLAVILQRVMVRSKNRKTDNNLIYVIAGKEKPSVDARCDEVLDELLAPQQRTTGLFNADADEVTASEVLDELRTLPFLTAKRVVLVRDADKFVSRNRELLEKYFEKPSPTGILILGVSKWDSRTRLARKLPKIGELITIAPPKAWQVPAKLIQYAADAHAKILSKAAAEMLIDLTGEELIRLYSEIDKLALFVQNKKLISPEDVASLTGNNRLFDIFNVIDSIISGNVTRAVNQLRKVFGADKYAGYKVLGAFAFHLRKMFSAKVLLEKGYHRGRVENELRIWYNKDGFFDQVRKMTLQELGQGLQQLAAIDYKIKTGQTKAHVAVEQVVLNLASVASGRKKASM